MFTGLIEAVGTIKNREENPFRLTIEYPAEWELAPGASVAVNGVCLTAGRVAKNTFSADVMQETRLRTNLAELRPGSPVNLERPLAAESRFDGHMVTGHVDGVARLWRWSQSGNNRELHLSIPEAIAHFVVPQGSLAVDGISLTVAGMDGLNVRLGIIPHTYEMTNLHTRQPGDKLNIEVDVMARYLYRWVKGGNKLEELLKKYEYIS